MMHTPQPGSLVLAPRDTSVPRPSCRCVVTRPGPHPLLIANCSVVRAANTTPVKKHIIFINICIDPYSGLYYSVKHNGRANA